ncbi:MAG: tetratricopeptide repeat protein [candidate division WOR-3 bacterium]
MVTENKKNYYRESRDLYLKALTERAQIYEFTGNYDSSHKDWKTLQYVTKEPQYRYEYYRGLSVLYERLGRFKSAAILLKKALLLCKRYPNLLDKAMAQSIRTRLMLEKGDYLNVIRTGRSLLNKKNIKTLPDNNLNRLLTNIGNAYMAIGKYEEALHFFLKARHRYKRINNLEGLSITENNLTLIYWKRGDYHKALEYSCSALAIRNKIGHRYGVSATLNNLGLINDEMGRYEEALSYYKRALEIFRELNDIHGMTIALSNIGSIYSEVDGDVNKALGYYRRSLELSRLTGDTYSVVEAIIELAEMHWCKKNYRIFEQMLRNAGRLIKSIHSEELNTVYLISLIKMYARKKLRSKLAILINRLIRQISISKNRLLCFEAIASLINLMYDENLSCPVPRIDYYTEQMATRLKSVQSPLKRAKILRALVKYYLYIGDNRRATMYYRLWETVVNKFRIKAHNPEINKIGARIRNCKK